MNGHAFMWHIRAASFMLLIFFVYAWPFKLGIENRSDSSFQKLKSSTDPGPRIGLITNQTSCDQSGKRTVDILLEEGVHVVYLLAPEHGFDGKVPAGQPITNGFDQKSGLPIISVYGHGGDETIAGKRIDPAILKHLDVLVYDIQDAGMRHYTYISTMLCALEATAESNKPLYIFDRPNLLGNSMEGPLVGPGLKSFISIAPIPLRHGMTVGELARYFNQHLLKKPAQLEVIPLQEYTRTIDRAFLAPLSPNIASEQSLYGYSFLGLLGEVRPFDAGVGTAYSFQVITLPDELQFSAGKWGKCATLLKKYDIQSSYKKMVTAKGVKATGLQLQFPQKAPVPSFKLFLSIIQFFKEQGITLSFSPTFDKAVGTSRVREWYDDTCPLSKVTVPIASDLRLFYHKARASFLYEPFPEIKA